MAYRNRGIKTYSEREKRAYSAGIGYGAGKAGKLVKCETAAEKKSFLNGLKKAKGGKK